MIEPEDENKTSGLYLSWVWRQLDLLTLVALSLEPPEERSGGGRQGYSQQGGGQGDTNQGILTLRLGL